jgi:hypothetical protein
MIVDPAARPQEKKLLDQVRDALRTRHYSYRTEQAYVDWIKRYILASWYDGELPRSKHILPISPLSGMW